MRNLDIDAGEPAEHVEPYLCGRNVGDDEVVKPATVTATDESDKFGTMDPAPCGNIESITGTQLERFGRSIRHHDRARAGQHAAVGIIDADARFRRRIGTKLALGERVYAKHLHCNVADVDIARDDRGDRPNPLLQAKSHIKGFVDASGTLDNLMGRLAGDRIHRQEKCLS